MAWSLPRPELFRGLELILLQASLFRHVALIQLINIDAVIVGRQLRRVGVEGLVIVSDSRLGRCNGDNARRQQEQ